MATTAAEIQKQALSWLRQNPGQRCCQHHWAGASGLTSPEHEQALGPLLRTVRIDRKQFSEFLVTDGVCARDGARCPGRRLWGSGSDSVLRPATYTATPLAGSALRGGAPGRRGDFRRSGGAATDPLKGTS